MILKLKDGDVKIELFEDVAPGHVKRIKELANKGIYDNVVFHRVIDGFMAQTGDVKFGKSDTALKPLRIIFDLYLLHKSVVSDEKGVTIIFFLFSFKSENNAFFTISILSSKSKR